MFYRYTGSSQSHTRGATGKKEDGASSISMMMGIQLNTLVDFHVLTEEQLNGILNQINQA